MKDEGKAVDLKPLQHCTVQHTGAYVDCQDRTSKTWRLVPKMMIHCVPWLTRGLLTKPIHVAEID